MAIYTATAKKYISYFNSMENDVIEIDVEKALISAHGQVNLQIKATLNLGELIVLFGDSGAGKTTLLRIISGLSQYCQSDIFPLQTEYIWILQNILTSIV